MSQKEYEGRKGMITLLFCILMIVVFGKLTILAIRAAWGVTKIMVCLVFAPFLLLVLLFAGLIYIAFPLLLIGGVIGLVASRV